MMKVAILTVSDSCARDATLDKSGPLLGNLINSSKMENAEIFDQSIVPDEIDRIESYLRKTSTNCDVILTTGGTGLASRDVTPDATRRVIERECNGISTALLVRGLRATPFAALTRLTAGTVGKCLIVNLPGNPKAVVESFEVLEEILGHAVSIIRGESGEVKATHKALSPDAN